jgi:hypothetical protein
VIPEDLDLEQLTRQLIEVLGLAEPKGYLRGKAQMRDAVVQAMGFSQLEAEELIDTLELRGFLRFLGDTSERSEADSRWEILPRPQF